MLQAKNICSRVGNATTQSRVRTLHLVDVDNLLRDPATTDRERIAEVFAQYRHAAGYRDGDHVVIATGRNGLHVFEVEAAWKGALHRRRAGEDGADLELLEQAEWAASASRFGRVVIGSGDRIFMTAVDLLRSADVDVDVVARPESLAPCLALQTLGHVFALDGGRELRPNPSPFRPTRAIPWPRFAGSMTRRPSAVGTEGIHAHV